MEEINKNSAISSLSPSDPFSLNPLNDFVPLGGFHTYELTDRGVLILCSNGSQIKIEIRAEGTVQIRASFQRLLDLHEGSWVVGKTTPLASQPFVKDSNSCLSLEVSQLKISINKSPLLITFSKPDDSFTYLEDFLPMHWNPQNGKIATFKKLGFDEQFYGLGEKAFSLNRRRYKFTNWNSDTYGYKEGTDPLYQSIPFYIGLNRGIAYGVFFDNTHKTEFDFGKDFQECVSLFAAGGEINYYFFAGPHIQDVISKYTFLSGKMPLPPLWSLGNQQSRWSYFNTEVVESVINGYREHGLPLDVVYLDIDYMDGYRVFTWDQNRFPNPSHLAKTASLNGVKLITIVDPGVKYEPYPEKASNQNGTFLEGIEKNYFQKKKDGSLYIAKVWPGESVFVDFTLAAAREWWGSLHKIYTDNGISGIWNDMNEPADFNDQDGSLKADVVCYDNGQYSTHAKNRNIFALLMAQSTYEGLLKLKPEQRPFVLTRSGYSGIQKYAATWTGDCPSTWNALKITLPMLLSMGLSGQAFVGSDIPGFTGNPSYELIVRWYELGFLSPLCRNHHEKFSPDTEPFRFPICFRDMVRKYLQLRYSLLPFLYTQFELASRTGLPVMRPLILNYQEDVNVFNLDDEFMIGEELLLSPVLEENRSTKLTYFPPGVDWVSFWDGRIHKGGSHEWVDAPLGQVPFFVKAGKVLPLAEPTNYVNEKEKLDYTFRIFPNPHRSATGKLYFDDGVSFKYQDGIYSFFEIAYSEVNRTGQITFEITGKYLPNIGRITLELPASTPPNEIKIQDDGNLANTKAANLSHTFNGSKLTVSFTFSPKIRSIEILF